MFHKIVSVEPLAEYRIAVRFEDGESRLYDVQPLFGRWDVFCALKDIPGLFELVKVDAGGYGVSWNDDIDLSCEELYSGGARLEPGNETLLTG